MRFLNYLLNYRQTYRYRKCLTRGIRYRISVNRLNANGKSLENSYDELARQAMEAERSGDHPLALRLAGQAGQLMRYRNASGRLRSSLEAAHAIQETSRALSDIAELTASAVHSAQDSLRPQMDPARLQAELMVSNERARALIDANDDFLQGMEAGFGPDGQEGSEEALRTIMRQSVYRDQLTESRQLNERLDQLMNARLPLTEGR